MKLNPEQRRAVTTTEGPVLVLAGAGTGKTRVITERIGHLVRRAVAPEAILAVTFTNKAAREMKTRISGIVGKKATKRLTVGTFHAFCLSALREHGERIGVPKNFSICDASDQIAAAKAALRDLHIPEQAIQPNALQARISLLKNSLVDPDTCLGKAVDDRDELVGRAYARYVENLRRAHALDFDDLLLETLRLMREDKKTIRLYRDRYRYLMVDEYQDTNGPQYEIVKLLAGKRRNLCVVGDDDQSIYGWRGADVRKILNFERDFPGCAVIRLETNYRSTQQIIDGANRVIGNNPARHEKRLKSHLGAGEEIKIVTVDDEEREAGGVIADIRKRVLKGEVRYKDIAILFRTAVQPRAFEVALRRHDIPYVLVGGQSFFDRKEVRDILAFTKLIANPDDEISLLRVVNTPPRGVGRTAIDRVLAFATKEGISAPQAFDRAGEIEKLPARAADAVAALRTTLASLRGRTDLVAMLRELLGHVAYREEIDRCYPEQKTRDLRWAGVDEVLNFAENYSRRSRKPTLEGFLEELALSASEDRTPESDRPRNVVTLMTLHAAKGLEFPRVYIVGAEEGILPHQRSVADDQVEEERRLMYVGITRAQRHLTITHVKERAKYGKRVLCMPSRFLFELQGEAPPKDWKPCGARSLSR